MDDESEPGGPMPRRTSAAEWFTRAIDYVLLPGLFLSVLAGYLTSNTRPQTPLKWIEYGVNIVRYSLVPVLLWTSRRPRVVRLNVPATLGLILAFSAPLLWEIQLDEGDWYMQSRSILGVDVPHAAVLSVVALLYTLLMIASYLNLGRSLSAVPALKAVVTRGLYRVVRHPVYSTALHLAAASLAAIPTPVNALCFGALNLGMWLRSVEEEKVLALDSTYRVYREQVHRRFYTPVLSAPLLVLIVWRILA